MLSQKYIYEGNNAFQVMNQIESKSSFISDDMTIQRCMIEDTYMVSVVMEQFFFRTSSYASCSLCFIGNDHEIKAICTASGAGQGVFNLSLGATKNFFTNAEKLLLENGFKKMI
ncbi:DUF6054 family protein [Anaerorhabdus sp.]|uniref:DUF6054 family protein n=1 Tax=Anaerorhabdus sp. TaxID=1872524 RepID=UPI002FC82ADC